MHRFIVSKVFTVCWCVFFWALSVEIGAPRAGELEAPLEIGSQREIFVDRYLIDQLDGCHLQLHRPQPAEIVLRHDRPWEKRLHYALNVHYDGQRYRMYYSANNLLCYAESWDGIHFIKPQLGLVELDGSRENNLVGTTGGQPIVDQTMPLPEVFLDRRPGVSAEERFKAYSLIHEDRSGATMGGWVSKNGWSYRAVQQQPLLQADVRGAYDGWDTMFWSEVENCYVTYFRYRYFKPVADDVGIRAVARMTSKDFFHWSRVTPMHFDDRGPEPPHHIYNNQTEPYFRAPHIYLATPARLMEGRRALTGKQAEAANFDLTHEFPGGRDDLYRDIADTVLFSTRAATTRYDLTFKEALVRPGLGSQNWVNRSNFSVRGIVPTGDREMSIYVNRHAQQKSCHVQRYRIRLDGFASLHAPFAGGEMITKPLTFAGKALELNYATSAAGSLRVEIQDAVGNPLPGYGLGDSENFVGDNVERVVHWNNKSDLQMLAGHPIRLRFVLQDADLYALRFRP